MLRYAISPEPSKQNSKGCEMQIELQPEAFSHIMRECLIDTYECAPDDVKEALSEVILYYSSPAEVYEWRAKREKL